MKNEISYELFRDLYDSATLTFSKIKKISDMTTSFDDDAEVIMDIVEDLMAAGLKSMDEIWEKASIERTEVAA